MNDPKNKLGQYAGLEQLSTQALEDLLQQDFAAGEDHSNPDLVMAIMEVMEQRTPQAAPAVDVDAAWNAFRAGKIAPMEPAAQRSRRSRRPPPRKSPAEEKRPAAPWRWRPWSVSWSAFPSFRCRAAVCCKIWCSGLTPTSPSCPGNPMGPRRSSAARTTSRWKKPCPS